MADQSLDVITRAIADQREYVGQWRRPSEALLFETIRAIDLVFCRELFSSDHGTDDASLALQALRGWGTNLALGTMIGDELYDGPFRLFPSNAISQEKADELLFQCGVLQRAELLRGWISEGLVSGLSTPPCKKAGVGEILVLKSKHPSLFHEAISLAHREWMSDQLLEHDREWERRLEVRHIEILPELVRCVEEFRGWGISYWTTEEIDRYFLEWGQVYLRRMWSQDLIGTEERIGGNQFNEYLGVLAALAGRAQKHICFAAMLYRRNPKLDLRNLLTSFALCDEFLAGLSHHLDADSLQVQKLLSNLILDPSNRDAHTQSGDTAWAPIIQSSHGHYLLPLYGLEINPFLFLLKDLRTRYPKDWSVAANNREKRWHADLAHIFSSERWIRSKNSIELRDAGRVMTDVDFLAYDVENNELAILQLKWQQPVGLDNRARRSAAKNLVAEGNKWIASVHEWLSRYGLEELLRRIGATYRPGMRAEMFVIGRYGAHFSGVEGQDKRAVWVDWNHFMKARVEAPRASVSRLAEAIKSQVSSMVHTLKGESYGFPIGDLSVLLNPSKEPQS